MSVKVSVWALKVFFFSFLIYVKYKCISAWWLRKFWWCLFFSSFFFFFSKQISCTTMPDYQLNKCPMSSSLCKGGNWERIEELNIIKCPKSTPKWIVAISMSVLQWCVWILDFHGVLCIKLEDFTFHSEMWNISGHSFDSAFSAAWTSYSDWIAWMNHGVHLVSTGLWKSSDRFH